MRLEKSTSWDVAGELLTPSLFPASGYLPDPTYVAPFAETATDIVSAVPPDVRVYFILIHASPMSVNSKAKLSVLLLIAAAAACAAVSVNAVALAVDGGCSALFGDVPDWVPDAFVISKEIVPTGVPAAVETTWKTILSASRMSIHDPVIVAVIAEASMYLGIWKSLSTS